RKVAHLSECDHGHRKLQPWLQGVIAVTVFLVLTVIALVINKIWWNEESVEYVHGLHLTIFIKKWISSPMTMCYNMMEGRASDAFQTFRESLPCGLA
uniref:Uncharacterized protein n=1 Tax=Varanus komodoensis TaxID=61221 RepID=A0A8D2L7J4_VARKO